MIRHNNIKATRLHQLLQPQTSQHDLAWRLHSLASPADMFNYRFSGADERVGQIGLCNGWSIAQGFDSLGRFEKRGPVAKENANWK